MREQLASYSFSLGPPQESHIDFEDKGDLVVLPLRSILSIEAGHIPEHTEVEHILVVEVVSKDSIGVVEYFDKMGLSIDWHQ